MKIKLSLIAVLLSFTFLNNVNGQENASAKEMESIYRKYVLAECIYKGFDKNKVFDKDISFSALSEMTDYVVLTSHGRKLDSLVTLKLQSMQPSHVEDYQNRKAIILESIIYYDSKELKRQIKDILKTKKLPL